MERYQNIYQSAREGAGLTQEKAAEMLGWSVRNLQAIEQEDRTPTPVRVAEMAEAYRAPWLRGYYCNRCPLGTLWRRPESNVELQQLALTAKLTMMNHRDIPPLCSVCCGGPIWQRWP